MRFAPGQGVICNNVLHARSAFRDHDAAGGQRLLWRARYRERVAGVPSVAGSAAPGARSVLNLSEILLAHRELESFHDLVDAVRQGARDERFFRMDIKPTFADTPGNWEDVLGERLQRCAGRIGYCRNWRP